MGLQSPFGYVGYETIMAELFTTLLGKLCAHCHTNDGYGEGCKECPAGNLIYECREYILSAEENDRRFEHYASDEWARIRIKNGMSPPTEEERQMDLKYAQDYKAECEILRAMKRKIEEIEPHPLFYIKSADEYDPYKNVVEFTELTREYARLKTEGFRKWGITK